MVHFSHSSPARPALPLSFLFSLPGPAHASARSRTPRPASTLSPASAGTTAVACSATPLLLSLSRGPLQRSPLTARRSALARSARSRAPSSVRHPGPADSHSFPPRAPRAHSRQAPPGSQQLSPSLHPPPRSGPPVGAKSFPHTDACACSLCR